LLLKFINVVFRVFSLPGGARLDRGSRTSAGATPLSRSAHLFASLPAKLLRSLTLPGHFLDPLHRSLHLSLLPFELIATILLILLAKVSSWFVVGALQINILIDDKQPP
jgi:hypothetical protein